MCEYYLIIIVYYIYLYFFPTKSVTYMLIKITMHTFTFVSFLWTNYKNWYVHVLQKTKCKKCIYWKLQLLAFWNKIFCLFIFCRYICMELNSSNFDLPSITVKNTWYADYCFSKYQISHYKPLYFPCFFEAIVSLNSHICHHWE